MIRVIAKVESTMLGLEDHGILSAMLFVTYGGGSGQGIGGYCLDEPIHDPETDRFLRRRGTAYGMEWVARCLKACGVASWEKIAGRTIMVLKEDDSWGARVLGIGPLPTERGYDFLFSDLAEEFGIKADA